MIRHFLFGENNWITNFLTWAPKKILPYRQFQR